MGTLSTLGHTIPAAQRKHYFREFNDPSIKTDFICTKQIARYVSCSTAEPMQHETLALAEGGKTSEVGFSLMKVALYSNGGSSATPLKSISNMNQKKRGLKSSQEKTEFRYSVNFTATEHAQFLTMFELSGLYSKSAFIRARVFNESFRVVKIDSTLLDYYQKLSELFGQFRSVGVNYNQVVKELKSNFTEKKALAMLFKLEKETKELGCIVKEIVFLTNEFREKWLQK